MPSPTVGIIAHPVSARVVRRVVASADGVQVADRADIVRRAPAALAACGIEGVATMPKRGGVAPHGLRGTERSDAQGVARFPRPTRRAAAAPRPAWSARPTPARSSSEARRWTRLRASPTSSTT